MRVHFLRPLCLKNSLAGALSSYKLSFFQETCHEMSFWEIARAGNSAFFTQNAFGLRERHPLIPFLAGRIGAFGDFGLGLLVCFAW